MRQLLAFAVEQDALDFQAATNAAFGMPLKDGVTVRYADVEFDFATGNYLHLLDDAMVELGIVQPATADLVADENAVQRAPTELQQALIDAGAAPVDTIAIAASTEQAIQTSISTRSQVITP
jgi:hypothetical protein